MVVDGAECIEHIDARRNFAIPIVASQTQLKMYHSYRCFDSALTVNETSAADKKQFYRVEQ